MVALDKGAADAQVGLAVRGNSRRGCTGGLQNVWAFMEHIYNV